MQIPEVGAFFLNFSITFGSFREEECISFKSKVPSVWLQVQQNGSKHFLLGSKTGLFWKMWIAHVKCKVNKAKQPTQK